jgi:SNF2 family DNA or RNA helicase
VVVDTGKRKLLGELVEDMGNEPIVVFCRFRKDLETVHDVAEKLGRPSFEISGSRKELDLWNSAGGILAVQIQSGGLGIDLTLARYAIYYSLGFSLGDYLQSVARVYRYGQTKPVAIYHLIADRTVDQQVLAALAAREEVVETIMRRGL